MVDANFCIDDPTAALGGLHGSELFWHICETNHLKLNANFSTVDIIDPNSISQEEFMDVNAEQMRLKTDEEKRDMYREFSTMAVHRFEFKLFKLYENGYFNNNPIDDEVSATISSELFLPEYGGMYHFAF